MLPYSEKLFFFAIIFCLGSGCGNNPLPKMDPSLSPFFDAISGPGVSTAEFICLPTWIDTRTGLTEQMLKDQWHYKIVDRHFETSPLRKPLLVVVQNSKSTQSVESLDLRWGCFFYDDNENPVGSILLDANGKIGYIGKTKVEFDRRLEFILRDLFREVSHNR